MIAVVDTVRGTQGLGPGVRAGPGGPQDREDRQAVGDSAQSPPGGRAHVWDARVCACCAEKTMLSPGQAEPRRGCLQASNLGVYAHET